MSNLDKDKYEVIPIGITKTGAWLLGTEPTQLLAAPDAQPDSTQSNQQATTAVTLTGDHNVRRLIPLQNGAQLHDNGALDVIFPVMHGTYGEDGALQGLLEMANVPYVGCGEHFTSPSVVFPNIRDIFLVIVAFLQSIAKFIAWRPDVVFAKGGFVSVPAGIAARVFNIPLVHHDSVSHPCPSNRIFARFANLIATGAPLNNYPYNRKLAHYTGIPISEDFHPYTDEERQEMKAALGFESSKPLVVITGGGLGAGHLNEAVAKRLEPLLELASIMLLSGTAHYDEMRAFTPQDDSRFQLLPFINSEKMAQSLGAADIVVCRAGATTILELSALAKPTILIPNAQLAAGQQEKR